MDKKERTCYYIMRKVNWFKDTFLQEYEEEMEDVAIENENEVKRIVQENGYIAVNVGDRKIFKEPYSEEEDG